MDLSPFIPVAHWASLAVTLWLSFVMFRDLGDVSQFWLKVDRVTTMQTWYRRHLYLILALLTAGTAVYTHVAHSAGYGIVLWVAGIGWTLNVFGGYFNPGWMMRPMQHNARFVSVNDANAFIQRDYEVIVIEVDGVARAHTDYELWRPHVVGTADGLNGENVVMTYCAMTNLPVAYRPEIDGTPIDLKVMTQLENNLVMWDKGTGEPIQQMWGTRESDGASGPAMPQHPCFKMPFGAFARAYPEGQVFHRRRVLMKENPVVALYDKFWEALFYMGIHRQKQEEDPIFPTLRHTDDRLPKKEHVWGFNVGEDHLCYAIPFVQAAGGLINVTVGGRRIVVHFDPDYESLGIWYNDFGAPVTEMTFFGQSDLGRHQRVETVKAGGFYAMWVNFYPGTDVNRTDAAASAEAA